MNVAQEIQRIAQAKVDLRKAITAKGVKIADTDRIDTYANKVAQIEGGGSAEGFGKYRVRFFDYDGTVLKTVYTDGGPVTDPNVPDHERLLFQEWNNDFDNVTSDLDVGAIYTTKSGKSEFDFDLNAQTGKSIEIGLRIFAVPFTLDWGDGSIETISTTGDATCTHEYPAYGIYTVKCSCAGDWRLQSPFVKSNAYALISAHIVGVPNLWGGNLFQSQRALRTLTIEQNTYANRWENFIPTTDNLTHFNVPRGAVALGVSFAAEAGLRTISLPINISVTHYRLFYNAKWLETIVLPHTFTELSLFGGTSIKELTVPPLVATIEADCFNQNRSLYKLILKPTTPPTISETSLPTTGLLKEIIVPAGRGEAYKSATNWSYYADIIKEEDIQWSNVIITAHALTA